MNKIKYLLKRKRKGDSTLFENMNIITALILALIVIILIIAFVYTIWAPGIGEGIGNIFGG
ncbi:MAG: hypothetical protein ABIF08_04550 [Nanoarchaeota archaeon]